MSPFLPSRPGGRIRLPGGVLDDPDVELALVVVPSASGQGEQREGDDQGAAHGSGTLAWRG